MVDNEFFDYLTKLEEEVKFLRQRNKDLRQKSWINVYDENLQLVKTVDKLRKELIKIGQVADGFYKENQHLKDVLKSVQTFLNEKIV